MTAKLPFVTDPAAVRNPAMCRRRRQLPEPLHRALADRANEHGLPIEAVLAAAFARTVADWSSHQQIAFTASPGGPVLVDMDPRRSFLDCAHDLHDQVKASVSFSLGTWLTHHVDEFELIWDTADALFPDGMVDSMTAAHETFLRTLAEHQDAWTGPARACLPPEQDRVRQRINATAQAFPDVLLHRPFWQQASRTPDAVAVIDARRTLTYRELRAGAAQLAHQVRPHRMVAVIMHKGWEQVLAVTGILAAGATYVPMSPDLPAERLNHLLAHAEITLAVTQPGVTENLPVPHLDIDESFLSGDEPPIRWERSPSDLAYIIYTSGSTGLPKGVMISHRGAVNTILDINQRFDVGPSDRVFALSSLGFDLSVYDVFGLLAAGGAIVIPAPGTERSPWEWTDVLAEHRVTVWNSVPALMEMLVEYSAGRGLRIPDSLRLVLMSGDWIPVTLPDRVRRLSTPDITLIGMGGATEASIWSNYFPIGTVDPDWSSIPYGTPLANQSFEVLDPALRRRPDWVPGELYIGGTGVAMGYWRDPAKTTSSFITHPETGQRLYRTGDLGRYHPDGNLEFLGREDFQVKINGYRVELGEIEAALHAHQDITGAVVIATGTSHDTRRLVAYVTPAQAPVNTLRKYLATKLPPYLVPERFTAMDQFPLTTNGKVDRAALTSTPAQGDGTADSETQMLTGLFSNSRS
ncbi:amino acid adenylation domain-containing protein [Amycolatopsis plumensis]|uniref:Amino acid adenylation domain-containing protein n=1 Tax=Amycolatopsis plumensis TaxID=236508 RepID=A0ABV5UIR8_9PSEU